MSKNIHSEMFKETTVGGGSRAGDKLLAEGS